LRDCLFVGYPNMRTVAHLLALFLLPQKIQQSMREWLSVPLGRPVPASNGSTS
jgi:hypothetical protein